MSKATQIQTKIDRVLTALNVTDRMVSTRVIKTVGGDPLLGRGLTKSVVDSPLDPQPAVQVASKEYPLVIAGATLSPDAEYLLTVSATAMTLEDVGNPNLSIIFTDAKNKVEELFIIGYQPLFINGVDIAFSLVLASKAR